MIWEMSYIIIYPSFDLLMLYFKLISRIFSYFLQQGFWKLA